MAGRRIHCTARRGSCGSAQACSHRQRCWWLSSCSTHSGKLQKIVVSGMVLQGALHPGMMQHGSVAWC